MKKKFILASFLVLFIFIIIAFLFFLNNYMGKNSSLTPTPVPTSSIEGALPGARNTADDKEVDRRSFLVGNLIDGVPYSGKNFSLYYRFSRSQFVLYINPKNPTDGNKEFDIFLKQNGVDDRSWIQSLVITNTNVTPAP